MAAVGSSAVAALLLAGASAPALPAYKALGTEPFWRLAMGRSTMVFEPMDGPIVRQKMPRAKKTRYGHVYWTRRVQVAIIRNQKCSDGMSDYVYRDEVKVTVDGRQFIGCGGPRHLPKGGVRP